MIRVVKVNKLHSASERATVVYVGRQFAGWRGHPLANPFKPRPINQDEWSGTLAAYWLMAGEEIDKCLERYQGWLLEQPGLEAALVDLWEHTHHGAKPLGCWCTTATAGDSSPIVCHAQILANLLHERFVKA